jgi:chromosome segregation ATPase
MRKTINGLRTQINEIQEKLDQTKEELRLNRREYDELKDEENKLEDRMNRSNAAQEDMNDDRKEQETKLRNVIKTQAEAFKKDIQELNKKLEHTQEHMMVSEVKRTQLKKRLAEDVSEGESRCGSHRWHGGGRDSVGNRNSHADRSWRTES